MYMGIGETQAKTALMALNKHLHASANWEGLKLKQR